MILVALASTAHADGYRPQLELLYEFPGIDVMESIDGTAKSIELVMKVTREDPK